MLHDGPGAAASAEPSRRWGEISSTLTEIGQDLQKALDLTGAGWSGPAAGAAYDRLATTVEWAAETGANAGAMRTSVEEQAEHIAKARAEMPKPEEVPATQPDPTVAPAAQVAQTQTDLEPTEAAAATGAEKAVEVMTAYETNTNSTTAALSSFSTPADLLPRGDMHQKGGGLLGILPTLPSGLLGGGRRDEERHGRRPSEHRGGGGGGGGGGWHHSPGTSGASSRWQEGSRRPLPTATPTPGPGKLMNAALDPLIAPNQGGNRSQEERNSSGRGNGSGNGPGNGSGSGNGGPGNGAPPRPGSSTTGGGLPPAELQQAAAASQAAANANPGAGAPLAPGAGAPMGGAQDKMGMRRFGMDAIGSSQWFGDDGDPVVGQSPKRRFDVKESEEVTESVSILGEEHKLPPNVIGDGR